MEDKYLIIGLKKKDKVVFDFIFNYYYSGLCAYSFKFIPNKSIVEDIVQDFFVQLWIKSNLLDINTSLKAYFFTSIKNKCLDFIKQQKVRDKYNEKFLVDIKNPDEDSYNKYIEVELREAILKALEKLPPRCNEIFQMSRFKGIKNQEIADQLLISKRTVEIQISQALKLLRIELKEFLPAYLILWLLG